MNARNSASVDVFPISITDAVKFTAGTHRRLPKVQGGMWALQAISGGERVGVCIVGRPVARMTCEKHPADIELTRMAVRDGAPNACSALYAAAARAARAMGATDLFSKIHADESGHSLRCGGWIEIGPCGGGEWSREGRERQLSIDPLRKIEYAVAWGRRADSLARRTA